jgi:hypothetical protein
VRIPAIVSGKRSNALSVSLLASLLTLALGCGGSSRLGPHETYRTRKEARIDTRTGLEHKSSIRVATLCLPASLSARAAETALRSVLLDGQVDLLLLQSVPRELKKTISRVGTSTGFAHYQENSGLGLLTRFPAVGREGREHEYPFEGYLLQTRGNKNLWTLLADTSVPSAERVTGAFETLVKRVESHAGTPVIVAVGFADGAPEANAEARRILLEANWFRVGAAEARSALYGPAELYESLSPAAAPPSASLQPARQLGLTMVDLSLPAER